MNAHRRSHAAETGQLIPRVRQNASSGDFNRGHNASICEPGKDNSAARSVSWPMLNTNSCNDSITQPTPSSTRHLRNLQTRILAKRLPLPPLRHAGSENTKEPIQPHYPAIPLEDLSFMKNRLQSQPNAPSPSIKSRVTTYKPCPSSWTDRLQEQLQEIQIDHERPAGLPQTNAILSYHNKTARRINPGFELLPSGTLATHNSVKEWGEPALSWTDALNGLRASRKPRKRNRSHSRGRRPSSEHEHLVKGNSR